MLLKNTFLTGLFALLSIHILVTSCSSTKTKHMYMNRTYKRLKKDLKDAQVTKLNDTVNILFPSNLMFSSNSATIHEEIMPKMNRFANALNKFSRTAILINGHTDNVGEEQYNTQLSTQRAQAAKSALIHYTVDSSRINTWGLGMRHPIASNETEEGRALNRRVEFVILYSEKE
jgi:outer membrane protein OmpA-like peptidoglycan-associated protein